MPGLFTLPLLIMIAMQDVLYLILAFAFFALTWLLVRSCARLEEGEKR